MPALLLLAVLLVPLFTGCMPGGARNDGVPSADAPFTLTALDVGQFTFRTRCIRGNRSGAQMASSSAANRGRSPLFAVAGE